MSLVAIEEQNLIDIADAIRSRSNNPDAQYIECAVSKSNNATGFDNVRTGWFQYSDNKTETITVDGASYLQVRIAYVHTTDTNTLTVNGQTFTLTPSYKDIYEENLTIEGDTVTFVAGTDYSSMSNLGYYAEVRGYDAEGNFIPYFNNMYKPREMAPVIREMSVIPEDAFVLKGDIGYAFRNGVFDWLATKYGDKITTKDITYCNEMLSYSKLKDFPVVINMKKDVTSCSEALEDARELINPPTIRLNLVTPNVGGFDFNYLLHDCHKLRDVENVLNPDDLEIIKTLKCTSTYSCPKFQRIFVNCHSLRQVPSWWYKLRFSEESTSYPSYNYSLYYESFSSCSSLDEVNNIPVIKANAAQTSNMFNNMFTSCYRLKNATFETNEDGTPIDVQWKSQVIDLTSCVGWISTESYVIHYNSGITSDKVVRNDELYQSLKNDPDWAAINMIYSRYNHDSAVATINSLPDTSAYLATAGGTNTIKFKGNAGSSTDGGAINTLTEEEIAIATAKGWTVSFV